MRGVGGTASHNINNYSFKVQFSKSKLSNEKCSASEYEIKNESSSFNK